MNDTVVVNVSAETSAAFERWWHNEGSAMRPEGTEDLEAFAHRVCEIAWANGAYKAIENCEHPARYGD